MKSFMEELVDAENTSHQEDNDGESIYKTPRMDTKVTVLEKSVSQADDDLYF
jgi:hypothetical protein